jgi:hypothetical protein
MNWDLEAAVCDRQSAGLTERVSAGPAGSLLRAFPFKPVDLLLGIVV